MFSVTVNPVYPMSVRCNRNLARRRLVRCDSSRPDLLGPTFSPLSYDGLKAFLPASTNEIMATFKTMTAIDSPTELDLSLKFMKSAQTKFATYSQEDVDRIFQKVAMEANVHRLDLALDAVRDTQRGVVEDKVIKNHFASEFIYNKYKDTKTCGVIDEDAVNGIAHVAEPIGPIVGVVPVTNPTSTVIFKTLLALKTRNCIIFSPHQDAAACVARMVEILHAAAVKAGAPIGCISCVSADNETRKAVLGHPDIRFILATGGPGIVKASYKSGIPAIGVGAGNTPAVVDETADIKDAVGSIVLSKTFDNGMICASENSVVVVESVWETFRMHAEARGMYFMTAEETKRVGDMVIDPITKKINPLVVGKSASLIADLAGLESIPSNTVVLAGVSSLAGDVDDPMSYEKLCPVLGVYEAKDFDDAVKIARTLVEFGGLGHTAVLYTDSTQRDRIEKFQANMPVERVLVDMPSSLGAIGDVYNFRLEPSLTLGCGSKGGSAVSENVGVKHLLDIKTVAERRENMLWFKTPRSIYFKKGITREALKDIASDTLRVFVVTDKTMVDLHMIDDLLQILRDMGAQYHVYDEITPDPTFSCIHDGVDAMNRFQPDTVIAFGGGSPMDASKIMRLLYEHPEVEIPDLTTRFLDIRKRVARFPKLGSKVRTLICIASTSGTGAEITPFAVVTGDDHRKYPICDYALTPDMAIVDPVYTMKMPRSLTAFTGYDALVHAIESYVSVVATDYTRALSLRAVKLIMANLRTAYDHPNNERARENMHNGSAIAGMAFANAFLGICHSLAHQIGATYGIPHGLANALFLTHVIRFNATDSPTKMAAFPQYKYPHAVEHYAEIADVLKLVSPTETDHVKVEALVEALEDLKRDLDIPARIRDYVDPSTGKGITPEEWGTNIDDIACRAFDDQCTGANPRYPLIAELKEILREAY